MLCCSYMFLHLRVLLLRFFGGSDAPQPVPPTYEGRCGLFHIDGKTGYNHYSMHLVGLSRPTRIHILGLKMSL